MSKASKNNKVPASNFNRPVKYGLSIFVLSFLLLVIPITVWYIKQSDIGALPKYASSDGLFDSYSFVKDILNVVKSNLLTKTTSTGARNVPRLDKYLVAGANESNDIYKRYDNIVFDKNKGPTHEEIDISEEDINNFIRQAVGYEYWDYRIKRVSASLYKNGLNLMIELENGKEMSLGLSLIQNGTNVKIDSIKSVGRKSLTYTDKLLVTSLVKLLPSLILNNYYEYNERFRFVIINDGKVEIWLKAPKYSDPKVEHNKSWGIKLPADNTEIKAGDTFEVFGDSNMKIRILAGSDLKDASLLDCWYKTVDEFSCKVPSLQPGILPMRKLYVKIFMIRNSNDTPQYQDYEYYYDFGNSR